MIFPYAAYFKKWSRKIENTQTPFLDIRLKESCYGNGFVFDAVKIEPTNMRHDWVETEVVLLVAFVENVLGYE